MSVLEQHVEQHVEQRVRQHGKDALATVLNVVDNIRIIEKNIYEKSSSEYDYKRNLYQTIGDIVNKKKLKDIVESIKQDRIGWRHASFDFAKSQLDEQDDFIQNPFQVEEGVIDCRCGSKRVFSYSKQCRSADEPMTTYAHCVECNSKWQYSG